VLVKSMATVPRDVVKTRDAWPQSERNARKTPIARRLLVKVPPKSAWRSSRGQRAKEMRTARQNHARMDSAKSSVMEVRAGMIATALQESVPHKKSAGGVKSPMLQSLGNAVM